jgi:hypothetical protein
MVSPVLSIAGNITPLTVPVALAVSASAVLSGCHLPQSKILQGPCCHLNHSESTSWGSLFARDCFALNSRSHQKLLPIVLLSISLTVSSLQLLPRNYVNKPRSSWCCVAASRSEPNWAKAATWKVADSKDKTADWSKQMHKLYQISSKTFEQVSCCTKVTSAAVHPSLNQSSKYPGILITCADL